MLAVYVANSANGDGLDEGTARQKIEHLPHRRQGPKRVTRECLTPGEK